MNQNYISAALPIVAGLTVGVVARGYGGDLGVSTAIGASVVFGTYLARIKIAPAVNRLKAWIGGKLLAMGESLSGQSAQSARAITASGETAYDVADFLYRHSLRFKSCENGAYFYAYMGVVVCALDQSGWYVPDRRRAYSMSAVEPLVSKSITAIDRVHAAYLAANPPKQQQAPQNGKHQKQNRQP